MALFKTVGERLDTLYLSLDGRGAVWDNNVENPDNHQHMIPKFEEIMAQCPNVQKLTLSFGIKATQVSSDLPYQSCCPNVSILATLCRIVCY